MNENEKPKTWATYEEVATYLLDEWAHEFGVDRFEGKQLVQGKRSGSNWEIDAKGVQEGSEFFIVVECRRYTTSRQNQEKVGALAYRILDSGAQGGILVSPLGLQEGANKVAQAEGIISVRLDAESTTKDFIMKFLDRTHLGRSVSMDISHDAEFSAIVTKNNNDKPRE